MSWKMMSLVGAFTVFGAAAQANAHSRIVDVRAQLPGVQVALPTVRVQAPLVGVQFAPPVRVQIAPPVRTVHLAQPVFRPVHTLPVYTAPVWQQPARFDGERREAWQFAMQIRQELAALDTQFRAEIQAGTLNAQAWYSLDSERQEIERDLGEALSRGRIRHRQRAHIEREMAQVRELRQQHCTTAQTAPAYPTSYQPARGYY
jgi:hypothetical protein